LIRCVLLLSSTILLIPTIAAQKTSETVADVDGDKISLQELTQASSALLVRLEQQAFRIKQQKLQELIEDRLLAHEAKRRNVSLESLINDEITSKAAEVKPQEIDALYELVQNRMHKPESEVEGQLRSLLHERNITARRHEFAKTLQTNSKVNVYLDPPTPLRMAVGMDGPSRGPSDALVTIVEFEDFQCPVCKTVQGPLQNVLLRYKDKVRVVHRDFPLQSLHPAAWKAHEAARCAEEHGKFWEYRDVLYKNAPAASLDQLTSYASQIGLESSEFKKCIDSGKFKDAVQRDEDEATRLGIGGTPAFFINGQLLSGAQPESEFVRVIDEELKTQGSDRSSKISQNDKTFRNSVSIR